MTSFASLWRDATVRDACAALASATERVAQQAVAIQQVPAPTFDEAARARVVWRRFREMGLSDVGMDGESNVFARVPGREAGPALLLSAHLDTVFPLGTDLTVQQEGERLQGPGIADNSLGVAGLLALAEQLRQSRPRRDVWLAANVGEEGLGNLQGMWAVMRRLEPLLGAAVVLEGGALGSVIHRGIGVQRRRLTVETAGGHAWSDFGTPSAIQELCRIGAAIAALTVPTTPRTSYNLGTIEGGSSINTIAPTASALLDLRSEEPAMLQRLAAQIDAILDMVRREGVTVRSEQIGNRPAGGIAPTHPLVRASVESLAWVGCDASLSAASTDANVPLAMGVPAVCIGMAQGHNAHRLDEYVELGALAQGLQHCFMVVWAAVEIVL